MTSLQLSEALKAWNTVAFESVLAREIENLGLEHLPLQQALATSSIALDDNINVMLIHTSQTPESILIKAGVFYYGVIAGCNCADDPSPMDKTSEYCVVQLEINKITAETIITLLDDN